MTSALNTAKTTAVRKLTLMMVAAAIAGVGSLMACGNTDSASPSPTATVQDDSSCIHHVNGYTRKDGTQVRGYDRAC